MIRDVTYPLNFMVLGPGVYEVVLEMSPIVCFNSFRDVLSP